MNACDIHISGTHRDYQYNEHPRDIQHMSVRMQPMEKNATMQMDCCRITSQVCTAEEQVCSDTASTHNLLRPVTL